LFLISFFHTKERLGDPIGASVPTNPLFNKNSFKKTKNRIVNRLCGPYHVTMGASAGGAGITAAGRRRTATKLAAAGGGSTAAVPPLPRRPLRSTGCSTAGGEGPRGTEVDLLAAAAGRRRTADPSAPAAFGFLLSAMTMLNDEVKKNVS